MKAVEAMVEVDADCFQHDCVYHRDDAVAADVLERVSLDACGSREDHGWRRCSWGMGTLKGREKLQADR